MTEHLRAALAKATDWERHHVPTVPQPLLAEAIRLRSLEDRISGMITDFAGSMRFVYVHTVWFGLWILVNVGLLIGIGLGVQPWDPFPFGFLTLIVSLEAIFLSTFVMVAQNRLSAIADARAQADYEINLKTEAEVAKLLHLVQSLIEHHIITGEGEAFAQETGPEATGGGG